MVHAVVCCQCSPPAIGSFFINNRLPIASYNKEIVGDINSRVIEKVQRYRPLTNARTPQSFTPSAEVIVDVCELGNRDLAGRDSVSSSN
jgi:hypothetical protein